jgi:RNA polymerase sigma-32 factor
MDMRFNGGDCSYDGWNDGEYQAAPAAYLEDLRYEPGRLVEQEDTRDKEATGLYAALNRLDVRSRDIVNRRWLAGNNARGIGLTRQKHPSSVNSEVVSGKGS